MRIRPYFTIRDLFWLTLVAAMGLAWWVDRQRIVDQCWESEKRIVDMTNRILEGHTQNGPAYALKVTEDAFYIEDTRTGRVLMIDKQNEQVWHQRGNAWVTDGPVKLPGGTLPGTF